jgi:diacylglycerol kinase
MNEERSVKEIGRAGFTAEASLPTARGPAGDPGDADSDALGLEPPSDLTAKADRRNARSKLAAGWRGLKSAIRGDSSFFAHGYRGTLIAITAALLGIDQRGWCLLVVAACLVLIAELGHSAVDTLARSIADPEEPRLRTAREIAAAGVLVAAVGSGAITVIILATKFAQLLWGGP